jgi:dipeptidyl-peptidase 4
MRRFSNLVGTLLLGCSFALLAHAQNKLLTLDELYGPINRVNFSGNPVTGLTWLDGQSYLQRKTDSETGQAQLLKVNALTGQAVPLYDLAKAEAAFAKLPGLSRDDTRHLAQAVGIRLNEKRTAGLANYANDLFYYEFGSDRAVRLTQSAEEEVGEEFSPDGQQVSFVRNFNLYVVDVAQRRERSLTNDGHAKLLNGRLDWVYQEELYGRGNFKGYWWSPDSTRIAYLQLDEAAVKDFTVVDHTQSQPTLEVYAYPKAGMPNPTARLGVINVAGGATQWVDLFRYQQVEPLIVRVSWLLGSQQVCFAITNREQQWLDLNLFDPATGKSRRLFHETSPAWVETDDLSDPVWLKDGSFLWVTHRSGWKHIYHYNADGQLIRQITIGKWEARTLHGVDEANGWVYFSGTERSHIGGDVYRIKLDGTGLQRLTETAGTHVANFAPDFAHFVDTWSDISTPRQVRLHTCDGKPVRMIDENKVVALAQYKLGKPEFLQVKNRDGFLMEALMIKPPDFDPQKKYPVFEHVYGGAHIPQVRNAWVPEFMWWQLLAQQGFIVWVLDNRSASGKGMESAWTVYKNFGEPELRDLEDGMAYLKSLPFVDGARIALYGWSNGGFITAYALTHSTTWKVGISGAPVTDWLLYDTICTERFMLTPQNNPEGYDKSSVLKAAKNLSGKLLLIHGAIDDNVHLQNSVQFIYELQKAGKQFEFALYPKSRHGITDQRLVRQMREKMLNFLLANL